MVKVNDEWVPDVFLALGSNEGNSVVLLNRAIERLEANDKIKVLKESSVYKTKAWGNQSLNDFYNMVLEVKTKLSPSQLLGYCLQVENELGRSRLSTASYENRTMDIDLIFFEYFICQTETLTVPHPYWSKRRFVVEPLCEIAPNFRPHNKEQTIEDYLLRCEDNLSVQKIE